MDARPEQLYEFGPFRLDSEKRLLSRGDQTVPLAPKAFDLLLLLVQNRGRVLAKSELLESLWPDNFVEEANLYVHISALRKALGESPGDHRYIVTAPRRGFSFVADVYQAKSESPESSTGIESRNLEADEKTQPAYKRRLLPASLLRAMPPRLRPHGATLVIATLMAVSSMTLLAWLQDSITDRVVEVLSAKLEDEERAQSKPRYTSEAEARRAYLKGRYFWNKRTRDGFEKAIEYFGQAIDLDPDYELAYTGLADTYSLMKTYNPRPSKDAYPKVREAAMKALAINDRLAEAHASLALSRLLYDWDWLRAGREFVRAIELDPNYPTARHWHGEYLMMLGRFEAALAEMKRAQELDPLSPIITSDYGWAFYYARDYDRAIEQSLQALELDPDFSRAHHCLALVYMQKGMYTEALAEFEKADYLAVPDKAYLYAITGKREKAMKLLERYEELAKRGKPLSFVVASIYAGLGEKEAAFAWLERAYRNRESWVIYLKNDPRFDNLRMDFRFDDLLRRIGSGVERAG